MMKNRFQTGMICFCAVTMILGIAASRVACAQEYTNRREVMQDENLRRDFILQGEYIAEKAGSEKYGLQLIADGDGKFRFVGYLGGLPGDGWKTGEIRILGTASVVEEGFLQFETTRFVDIGGKDQNLNYLPMEFKKIKVKYEIPTPQGQRQGQRREPGQRQGEGGLRPFTGPRVVITPQGVLDGYKAKKTFRSSPTLGEMAPEGAVVIFDGTNLDMFEEGAQMNESRRPGGNTLWAEATAKPFEQKPYHMHLEFMLSYMPTAQGQARSNSGVYIDEAYECQVLDSFGLDLANNECGGFYQVAEPAINVVRPPLTWQTYDFFVTPPQYDGDEKTQNARITVKLNGVTIHDDIAFPQETPGRKKEANEPRGVYLQGHGNKVQYRNIWVKYL